MQRQGGAFNRYLISACLAQHSTAHDCILISRNDISLCMPTTCLHAAWQVAMQTPRADAHMQGFDLEVLGASTLSFTDQKLWPYRVRQPQQHVRSHAGDNRDTVLHNAAVVWLHCADSCLCMCFESCRHELPLRQLFDVLPCHALETKQYTCCLNCCLAVRRATPACQS